MLIVLGVALEVGSGPGPVTALRFVEARDVRGDLSIACQHLADDFLLAAAALSKSDEDRPITGQHPFERANALGELPCISQS
ncbi:hypothetical protein VWX35_10875 [Phaeobacter sp. A36a-5a]|uniref:hypothetical protein n=1 Tax=unclassified Phaeobacter TaxID=2621772 RepID=UPI003A8AB408